jgi:hypothetical protein
MIESVRMWCAIVLIAVMTPCHAASLLVFHAPAEQSRDLQLMALLGRSLGLELVDAATQVGAGNQAPANVVGLVVTADMHASPAWAEVEARLRNRPAAARLPKVIIGAGMPVGSTPANACAFEASAPRALGKSLSGMRFPCGDPGGSVNSFHIAAQDASEVPLVEMVVSGGTAARRVVASVFTQQGRDVYRIARAGPGPRAYTSLADLLYLDFGAAGAMTMVLGGLAGERAWHADSMLANLTIDDPWLKEPYGGLSYRRELDRMDKAGYHTTIAFVPWNFDRSETEVAALVRAHPQRFSLSIHGNNHDHEEFADHRSLEASDRNILQGLARMNRLGEATGLPYDRVMIFPQRIARDEVLGLLRQHRFSCTVNLQNRRHAPTQPQPPANPWSGFVSSDQGIPSLKRELPAAPLPYLAVLAFLGTPVLLHTHHEYFLDSDFSSVARDLNRMSPQLRWTGLGDVCDHLYLRKLSDDDAYDVLLFGTRTQVSNPSPSDRLFRFKKPDAARIGFKAIEVDGKAITFDNTDGGVNFQIVIPGSSTATVVARYADELPPDAATDLGGFDLRVSVLRRLSDFRDNALWGSAAGRALVEGYYRTMQGRYRFVDGIIATSALLLMACIVVALWSLRRRSRRLGVG